MVNLIESLFIKLFEKTTTLMKGREQYSPKPDELFIGEATRLYHPKQTEKIYLPISNWLHHKYYVGATGSGKTKHIESQIRDLIRLDCGLALIDMHGDLFRNVIAFLSDFKKKVRYHRKTTILQKE